MSIPRLLFLAVLLLPSFAGALDVPYLAGRVNDTASLVSSSTEERLERQLETLESDTGAQIAVLTLASLEGEVLEDFSIRVVETWQLGQQDVDNGILILVARDERQIRIEVGYGLEGTVPDVYAKRIISDRMVPRFRQGDFGGGIAAAVDSLDGLVRGDSETARRLTESPRRSSGDGIPGWLQILIIAVIILLSIFGKGGRRGRGGIYIGTGGGGGFSFGGGGGGFSGGGGSFGGGGASGSW